MSFSALYHSNCSCEKEFQPGFWRPGPGLGSCSNFPVFGWLYDFTMMILRDPRAPLMFWGPASPSSLHWALVSWLLSQLRHWSLCLSLLLCTGGSQVYSRQLPNLVPLRQGLGSCSPAPWHCLLRAPSCWGWDAWRFSKKPEHHLGTWQKCKVLAPLKNYKTRTLAGVGGGQQSGGLTSPLNDSYIHRRLLPADLNQQIVWPGEGPRLVLPRNKWETSSSSGFLRWEPWPSLPKPKHNCVLLFPETGGLGKGRHFSFPYPWLGSSSTHLSYLSGFY